MLLGLARAEERHAAHWARLLGDQAGRPRNGNPRMRLLAWLAQRFGSVFVLALAQRAEARTPYDDDADATAAMSADERIHQEVVRGLAARGRARVSGTFRAAVFGANDGLVSNLSLVLGVTGGGVAAHTVLLTGVAGLLAGALSMGAGEYVSVRSQRELLRGLPARPHRAAVPAVARRRRQRARSGLPRPGHEHRGGRPPRRRTARRPRPLPRPLRRRPRPGCRRRSRRRRHRPGRGTVQLRVLRVRGRRARRAVPVRSHRPDRRARRPAAGRSSPDGQRSRRRHPLGGPPLRRGLRQLVIGAGAAGITYALGLLVGGVVG